MQKEKNPENATKLLSNLVGVAGAHIDALDSQGMHDKLYFNWTAFTQPEFVTHILDYSQVRQLRPSIRPSQGAAAARIFACATPSCMRLLAAAALQPPSKAGHHAQRCNAPVGLC